MDHRLSFLPSPKAVFCPALEWVEGVHDEGLIMSQVLDAINRAGICSEGTLIGITKHAHEYLTYLHGHSNERLMPSIKLSTEDSFAAIDKNLREGRRITLLRKGSKCSLFKQLRHPVLPLLYDGDIITPLFYGYLICRKHPAFPELTYYLVQGTI